VPVAGIPKPVPFAVRIGLYSAFPENSRNILSAWLLGTDFDLKAGKKDNSNLRNFVDFKLQTGQRFTVGSLQTGRPGVIVSHRYGVMVYGPKWTLCLGVAMGEGSATRSLTKAQKEAALQAFASKAAPTLFAVAASVTWSSEKFLVRADIKSELIKKKTYHYHYRSSSNITNSSFEKYRYWTFRPDSCDSKGNTSFFVSPDYNLDGLSGMVSSNNFERSSFRVLEWKKQALLIVKQDRFFGSLHTVEMNKSGEYGKNKFEGLAIDGEIEGKYSKFNGKKFRSPPP
ncbi:MAG: hypothetical protein P1V97_34325, partial [Planctomycetota bacterium]|nr:hypothetical protein [Planctomycetota bacterium]